MYLVLVVGCGSGESNREAEFRARKESALSDSTTWETIDVDELVEPKDDWDLRGPDSQWVYAGRWVTHPPLEMVVQLVGEAPVNHCVVLFQTTDAWSCDISVDSCFHVKMFASGNVQLDIDAKRCPAPSLVDVEPAGFSGQGPRMEVPTGKHGEL